MSTTVAKTKRPSSITLISVFAIYSGLLLFYWLFSAGIQQLGPGNSVLFAIGGTAFIVCGLGFWLMKKWAVYGFAVFVIINQLVLLFVGRWNILSLLLSAIIVYVGIRNLSKMA